ncbi:hypothetical protein RhiirA5_383560 [Rhizophagus irregularis]|uniref:HTH myb-type domain-containing protein n=1 Tax=Rhizophagus irregularis TaxID=588596 RepID=A0A2I1EL01_9GLOM|nr:hypothetical protein RhiirA5_383560 [Rhizophagus irregularis]PKC61044.1 hypothetical protein RhiirA1_398720 [Rhizophagus irregularis]PKY22792.1 hypothetical protein RhiirB3_504042 [Rhizophagus irregularis]
MCRSKAVYFTEEDDNMIIKHMKTYGKFTNRFVIINGLMNEKFTNSQISERWRNYLNPELCKEDLGYYEKVIIDDKVQKILVTSVKIRWREVIRELLRLFGKLYSENKIKNYWNLKYRNKMKKDLKNDAKKETKPKSCSSKYSKGKEGKERRKERTVRVLIMMGVPKYTNIISIRNKKPETYMSDERSK